MATSTSKLHVAFYLGPVAYYVNESETYFAAKGLKGPHITRISKSAFESAKTIYDEDYAQAESAQTESESVPASDPTPATVDAPAPIEAAPVTVDPSPVVEAETVQASDPILDGATRPDWDSMQTFERITLEDVQAVPALVARGLGFVAMGLAKVAAMGLGALAGLGLMGLRRCIAR